MTQTPDPDLLAARYRELAQLQRRILQDEAALTRLAEEKAALDDALAQARAQLVRCETRLDQRRADLARLRAELADQRSATARESAARAAAEQRLAQIAASLSWRITAPLRRLRGLLPRR